MPGQVRYDVRHVSDFKLYRTCCFAYLAIKVVKYYLYLTFQSKKTQFFMTTTIFCICLLRLDDLPKTRVLFTSADVTSCDIPITLTLKLSLRYRQILCLLAHLSRRLIGELIVYQWSGVRPSYVVRRPSSVGVVHNAQRSSSPKLLVRSKPNFMWSLLG